MITYETWDEVPHGAIVVTELNAFPMYYLKVEKLFEVLTNAVVNGIDNGWIVSSYNSASPPEGPFLEITNV